MAACWAILMLWFNHRGLTSLLLYRILSCAYFVFSLLSFIESKILPLHFLSLAKGKKNMWINWVLSAVKGKCASRQDCAKCSFGSAKVYIMFWILLGEGVGCTFSFVSCLYRGTKAKYCFSSCRKGKWRYGVYSLLFLLCLLSDTARYFKKCRLSICTLASHIF